MDEVHDTCSYGSACPNDLKRLLGSARTQPSRLSSHHRQVKSSANCVYCRSSKFRSAFQLCSPTLFRPISHRMIRERGETLCAVETLQCCNAFLCPQGCPITVSWCLRPSNNGRTRRCQRQHEDLKQVCHDKVSDGLPDLQPASFALDSKQKVES